MTAHGTTRLVRVNDLRVYFGARERPARAVDGLSFEVHAGETVALVGESGGGKSVAALALARLNPEPPAWYAGGQILFRGRDVLTMGEGDLRRLRGRGMAYVFQEPAQALNPVLTIGRQIREALDLHDPSPSSPGQVRRLLEKVDMADPDRVAASYPHQLSGGMQQRAVIAMALACRPELLIADEPTTALDVTLQAQILKRLAALRDEFGMAILLITHNFGLVAELAERAYVMYAGTLVESGPVEAVLEHPAHPYTRCLLAAVPRLDGRRVGHTPPLRGQVPSPVEWPAGCRFHPRCPLAQPVCAEQAPNMEPVGPGHEAACPFWRAS
mgnify:CR=1 FL=1